MSFDWETHTLRRYPPGRYFDGKMEGLALSLTSTEISLVRETLLEDAETYQKISMLRFAREKYTEMLEGD